ncbi:MAG: PorV/PorQ family protein, partial [candidate division Zixibacteria bacterium]|nr:PorV/PorQ family protein [candidate division Zixibacteria bacterium]
MRKTLLLVLLLGMMVIISSKSRADVSRSGVLFLRIAAGARAAGMGEAFVAISDDATATHWNPAGLGLYPLTSTFLEYPFPSGFKAKSVALLRNDIPETNYKRYDIWALSDLDLVRLSKEKWSNYENYATSLGESVESIIRKYSQERDEERVGKMVEVTSSFNNSVSKDSLKVLKERVLGSLPPDSESFAKLSSSWESVLEAWDKCLLKPKDLLGLTEQITRFFSDDSLSSEEVDRISSSLSQTIGKRLPETLRIPYRALFPDTLTSVASEGDFLWVGTKKGLFVFDRKQWKRYGQKDGLPSDFITTILPVSKRLIWVGTDQGIAKFDGANWSLSPFMVSTVEPFGKDLPDKQVVDIANRGEREFWAATPKELFKFDGETWQSYERYVFKIGDDLKKVLKRFLGIEDEKKIAQAIDFVKKYNAPRLQGAELADSNLSPGQEINLPFNLAIKAEITTLVIDDHHNLWVGTKWGLKRYADTKWSTYGYRVYTATEGDDVNRLAEKFLGSGDEERVERFSKMIMEYNHLDSAQLKPGQKLYVYYNATGSHILSLVEAGGDKLFVGTEYGTVRWDGEGWGRYYHSGLERAKTEKIIYRDGELWFATPEKVVIYAHAQKELTFMHVNWLPELASDLYYEYLSYVQHMEGWGTVGASLTFLSLGKNVRTDASGAIKGEFDSYELAFAFSYGTKLNPNLSTGLSAKIIYSHLSDQGAGMERGKGSGSSFALDMGLLYQIKRFSLGTALTNLGPSIAYIDLNQSDPLPRNLAIGFAFRIVDTPFNRLTATFEINKELVGLNDPMSEEIKEAIENMGIEYWYGTYVALRAGYIYDKYGDIKTATFGAGLQYRLFRFDFAYIPSSKDLALANTMRFSMTGRF